MLTNGNSRFSKNNDCTKRTNGSVFQNNGDFFFLLKMHEKNQDNYNGILYQSMLVYLF